MPSRTWTIIHSLASVETIVKHKNKDYVHISIMGRLLTSHNPCLRYLHGVDHFLGNEKQGHEKDRVILATYNHWGSRSRRQRGIKIELRFFSSW